MQTALEKAKGNWNPDDSAFSNMLSASQKKRKARDAQAKKAVKALPRCSGAAEAEGGEAEGDQAEGDEAMGELEAEVGEAVAVLEAEVDDSGREVHRGARVVIR